MRSILIIAAMLTGLSSGLHAQGNKDSDSGQGSGLPSSDRGPAFPKGVSPTASNPTNWVAPKPAYTDPYGPNNKRYYRRWR
jgi:hypothetical protein